MEIHLIHKNSKYATVTDAVQHSDGLAVLGIFYETSTTDNANLAGLLSVVNQVRKRQLKLTRKQKKAKKNGTPRATTSSVAVPSSIKLSQMIPSDTQYYYYYQGGLTTPTCDEVVLWTNFMSTLTISESQLAIFRALTDSSSVSLNDNFRPPQPLNGRTVYTNKEVTTTTDPLAEMLAGVVNAGIIAALVTALIPLFSPPPVAAARNHYEEDILRKANDIWG